MKLELEFYNSLCATEKFIVNNIKAYEYDFGRKYDREPNAEATEEGGCGDMYFEPKEPTKDILDKYNITPGEYALICSRLDRLSFEQCYWCS